MRKRLRTFSLAGLFFVTLAVAAALWLLLPSVEDQNAEKRIVGRWEVRLEEMRNASTETRIVEFPIGERYGMSNILDSSQFWQIRNGTLLSRTRYASRPSEGFDLLLDLEWKNDDEFVATIAGTQDRIYYRRLPQVE